MNFDRRTFLKTIATSMVVPAVGIDAVSASAMSSTQTSAATPRSVSNHPPNVLLMICDDLGFGDLGCYGSKIPTPNLDRLAASGTRCVRHNAAHPICSASRAALLTGRYAPRSHTPGALFPHQTGMDKDEQTLADLFRASAYQTHAIGKWHLGDTEGYWPTDRGFDSFYGVPYSDDMQPLPLMRDTTPLDKDTDRDELTPRYTEEALKLIDDAGDKPFFLYLAYSYPHDPARGSKAFRGRSKFGDYGDAIEEIDWSVGKLIDALEKKGYADNTIVIFTSDHGPWFQGSPGAIRGRKGSTFEGGARVPFLIKWPGRIPSATVCNEWTGHMDVLPTLSRWCGLEMPRLPLDGVDVSRTWTHKEPSIEKPVLYFYPMMKPTVHCIRLGSWKLRVAQSNGQIYINDLPRGTGSYLLARPELYDLDLDPAESYDSTKKYPEMVRKLQEYLDEEVKTFGQDVQDEYAALQKRVASAVTPPGAAPRILKGPMPAWAWEPPDRR